ncbi:MAG TPA: hypothetical protein ENK85_12100 [Saprospiraceae bacterium]|nr:hypothetical protein [Saprospiraceae bacterium]
MRKMLLIGWVLILASCNSKVDYSPRKINFDRDACFVCNMGLTDQRYNVQAINKYGEVRWYDDIGCLAEDIRGEGWKKWDGETAVIWIGDASKGNVPSNWIDAKKAYYTYGEHTPMGYGYSAHEAKPDGEYFDYLTTLKRINEGKTMREKFVKEKKMLNH